MGWALSLHAAPLGAAIVGVSLLLALAVDRWWGEPPVRWHPVVWMGNFLGRSGGWLQGHALQDPIKRDYKAFWLAALVWIAGAALFSIAGWWLQQGLLALPWWLAALGLGLLLKPMLAWALLRQEVQAVESALGESLEAGRERLRTLVSRDVSQLDATTVRESAIETLAENLNDSVVAPVFWFVLLGLPGAVLFRFANTADAMWGYPGIYHGKNWAWAGKWAARADDVLGWVPARITALLLMLVGRGRGLRQLRAEAARPPSPNSGWPMAAMALVLGVRLAKPGGYVLHASGRSAQAADTAQALAYASKSVLALMVIAQAAMVCIAVRGGS
ncbi:adenosylcobinamide-phosphate synthase CbiB [Curvibacter sp. APW13]|uniref:adenosylcobinamide-phosphate synthase CbiB n=1 Tax=Curvibacter sp. APW13 TaxID=3077236 RepID=UPI0028DEA02A|nr:adenosylcobinamide-phosphate synthase CbiB [Curvibacter sp. APW13]MDT8991768.1 adenosylcobinamide-phosphate synthase CbiB [Curvibacter sp. APW13]